MAAPTASGERRKSVIPRGIRNNNPGNIVHDGTKWLGLAEPPSDGRFCRFVDPEHGIRAIARIVTTYYEKHGLNTIRQIIDRWAPPNENYTAAYVAHVADRCGVGAEQVIDPRELPLMVSLAAAIIMHENGQQPYDDATIRSAVMMA